MLEITSLQNPRVKNAVRLRDARHRREQGRMIIDGVRELDRAIQSGVKLLEVFVCPSLCSGSESTALLQKLSQIDAEQFEVPPTIFQKIAFGDRAEGVLGVAEIPRKSLEEIVLPSSPLVVVLEGVEKPGNLGAILRSADAAGVSALIMADSRVDLYNPNAVRASLGTLFTLPVCEASSEDVLRWLRIQQLNIFAARVDGSVPYTSVDYRGPTAFVLGSEAAGLTSAWTAPDITPIHLPMLGIADSLNVSTTAAVLFYESLRQRTEEGP